MLRENLGHSVERIAVGRLGWGSDCIGADDEISRDHAWGPQLDVLLLDEDMGGELERTIRKLAEKLPSDFLGYRVLGMYPGSVDGFFNLRVGRIEPPTRAKDWLYCREHGIFDVTHGEVFYDGPGILTRRREEFGRYYPRDVWLKRLSACCMWIYGYGDLNFSRAIKRKDLTVTHIVLTHFVEEFMQFIFLVNRQYAPYWKWRRHELLKLPCLANEVDRLIALLVENHDWSVREQAVRDSDRLVRKWLVDQQLSSLSLEANLALHARDVHNLIEDAELREVNVAIRYIGES